MKLLTKLRCALTLHRLSKNKVVPYWEDRLILLRYCECGKRKATGQTLYEKLRQKFYHALYYLLDKLYNRLDDIHPSLFGFYFALVSVTVAVWVMVLIMSLVF